MPNTITLNKLEFVRATNPVGLYPPTMRQLPVFGDRVVITELGGTNYTVDAPNVHGDGAEVVVGKKPSGRQWLTVIRVAKAALVECGKKSVLLEEGEWYVCLEGTRGQPVEVK